MSLQAPLPGDNLVIPDCIPFSSIPHTTRIFSDFLSYYPEARKFFPIQPDAEHVIAHGQVGAARSRTAGPGC